jgi:hypothetical protein
LLGLAAPGRSPIYGSRLKVRKNFTLRTLIVSVAFIAAMAAIVSTRNQLENANRKIELLEAELNACRPIPFWQVALQFEKLMNASHPTYVTNVHYNSLRDIYTVDYEWKQVKTGTMVSTDLTLVSDGNGTYSGNIRHPPFAKSIQNGDDIDEVLKVTIQDIVANAKRVETEFGKRDEILDRILRGRVLSYIDS